VSDEPGYLVGLFEIVGPLRWFELWRVLLLLS
jgi:hypothetical protein